MKQIKYFPALITLLFCVVINNSYASDKTVASKILKRQSIECNFANDGYDDYVVFQIDEVNKLLRSQDGLPYKTIRFDDDFIDTISNHPKSKGIKIDRKTGKITIGDSFFGICKKRDTEKKF
jgi:muconolactone delta-isomerase